MNSVIFISLVLSVFDQPFKNDQDWSNYKIEYSKIYLNRHEEVVRYNNFKANNEIIKAHNQKYLRGKIGYEMGHNEFSDMSHEELAAIYLHPIKPPKEQFSTDLPFNSTLPEADELSYKQFCFTPLNQGSCGSCWAFSAAAQVEAQLKRKYSDFDQYISPQYTLDCSNGGSCDGGHSETALSYMNSNGIASLKDYPYTSRQGQCNSNVRKLPQKIQKTFSYSLQGDEEYLKKTLVNFGPVVVYMQIESTFFNYKQGVYWDQKCPSRCETINHAVVLVGYGTDKTTYKQPVDYWIVKNSWGTTWGEAGYVRMIKGWPSMKNNCNIACFIRYAVV